MKNLKRILAMALVLIMSISIVACHKKDEIAVTVKDIEFTSAYYMCAMINADLEARSLVNEELSGDEQATDVDYYSKKIENKKYVDWVKDTTIENLTEIAAYKLLCKEKKVELDKEVQDQVNMYAEYYWSYYGHSEYFEPNGVNKETYTKYMKDGYYSARYFEALYGKDGEKEIAADEVKTKIYDNFIIANVLEGAYDSNMTDSEKANLKAKFEGYVDALNKKTRTFEEIYKEFNEVKDEETKEEQTESDEPTAKDKYATILGAKDTAYDSEHYETVKAMKNGEVKLIELEENAGLVLVVKREISEDEYYLTALDMTARHLIKDKEFEDAVNKYIDTLKADVNKYAINQFKVKKIIVPES